MRSHRGERRQPRSHALPDRCGGSIDFLSKIGAVTKGELLSVLTCRASDGDHPVRLEFDSTTGRHWHFCPEAGRVMVAIEKTKLVGWTKGLRKGLNKPAQLRAGRPSDATLVDEVFRERRTRKLPLVYQRTEAEKIRAEIALRHPERNPPAVKTMERHLSRMSKAKSG